jgi:hypothetical protein
MRNLDDLRLSLTPAAGGGIVDAGIVTGAAKRIQNDPMYKALQAEVSALFDPPHEQIVRLVGDFTELCIKGGANPSELSDILILTGAMVKTATDSRADTVSALRATADGIEANGA